MALPENNQNIETNPKKSGLLNILLFVLLLLVIISISFLVYLKSQNISIEDISIKDLFGSAFSFGNNNDNKAKIREINYDNGVHPVFTGYDNMLIECYKDSIKGFDGNGDEKWSMPVSVGNPVLKVSGSDLLVGDLDGREIYMMDGKNIKWNKKMDNNIINIDINAKGYVSVLHEAKGHRGEVTVYNRNGVEEATRTVSDSFPLISRVSPSCKQFMVNSVDASGINASTKLTFADMSEKDAKDITPREDVVFPFTCYLDDGLFIGVSDSSLLCYDQDLKEKWKYEFNERKIFSSDILQGKYTVIAVNGEDKSGKVSDNVTDMEIYNKDGEKTAAYSVESKVKNIKTYSDLIGINTGREIFFINSRGKLLDKFTSKADVSEMLFINRHEIAVITKSKIIFSEINT